MIDNSKNTLKQIERIDQFLSQELPNTGSLARRDIAEDSKTNDEVERKKQEIQRLKDRVRIEREINRSLRNQMKTIKARKS